MLIPYRPGSIAAFNVMPLIGMGMPTGPLLMNPPAEIETPDIQRIGVGRLVTFRRWGFPPGNIPADVADKPLREWAKGPNQVWGMGRETAQLDSFDQYQSPASASEVLRPFELQRCIEDLSPQPDGVSFEILRYDIPSASIGIVERVPTVLDVEALGPLPNPQVVREVLFSYGSLDGSRPCRDQLEHPDPLVLQPLTWQFRITLTHDPGLENVTSPLQGPIIPRNIPGDDLVEPWRDLRFGTNSIWGDKQGRPILPRYQVRYWITLFGPAAQFRVTVGARLGGYWQLAGRRGDALYAATRRIS